MPEAWPPQLQQLLNDNYQESAQPSYIKTEVDSGPVKTRVRYTKPMEELSCEILVSNATQYPIFKTFYNTTLSQGTKTFYFNHPVTGVQTTYQFMEPPTFQAQGPLYMTVSMKWRAL
jgi:hypothetical protein